MFRTALQPMYERAYPSLLATLRSACHLGSDLSEMYEKYPQIAVRLSKLWYTAFCAVTALFVMIDTHPSCPMCTFALSQMLKIVDLFRRAAPTCTFAAKSYVRPLFAPFCVDGYPSHTYCSHFCRSSEIRQPMRCKHQKCRWKHSTRPKSRSQ